MEVVASAVTRGERVRPQASLGWQSSDRDVEEAGLDEPPHEVVAAEPARQPWGPAARQDDVATRHVELLGDLAA
jgi:hypothetical protein